MYAIRYTPTSARIDVWRTEKILVTVSTVTGEVVVVSSEIGVLDPSTSQNDTAKLPHVWGLIATAPRSTSLDQVMSS